MTADPSAGARRLFAFGLVGPSCLFAAAACAALAANGTLGVALGAYTLRLLQRDLAGLAAVFALAGAACLGATVALGRRWKTRQEAPRAGRFLVAAAIVFLPLFAVLLVIWPSPPIRLDFAPSAPADLVGYRVWVRGNKHGPAELRADGMPVLLESSARPGVPLTCDIDRSAEFGPFGWARYARRPAPGGEPGLVAGVPSWCREGVDLARVSDDRRARELLEPFVLLNRLEFDVADVDAAEGRPDRSSDETTPIGRYLVFERSPELAAAAPVLAAGILRTGPLDRRGAGYDDLDHVLAVYRCDRAYAAFLEGRGLHAPPDIVELATALVRPDADPGRPERRDESSWRMRLGPIASLRDRDPRIAVSRPLTDPACAELFAYYRGLPRRPA